MPPRKLKSNPAQRLYDLLTKHAEAIVEHNGSGLWPVWKAVLDVPDEDFLAEFTTAFSLIAQIDLALQVTDDEIQRRTFQLHAEEWRRAFIPDSSGVNQTVIGGEVSEIARVALGGIASHLRDNLPDGLIPDGEQLAGLRGEISASIDAVMSDEEIPMAVRGLLLRRLHDALWAVDHVATMGAEGISAACDRLAMAMQWSSRQDIPDRGFLTPLKEIVIRGYAIIGFSDTLYGGFEAWTAIEPTITKALGG